MTYDYDIIIVGGGMVGLACARALADSDLRIGVIERQAAANKWSATDCSARVSAINQASQRLFETLGIWPRLLSMRVSAYQKMLVWDENSAGEISFSAKQALMEQLGFIIENAAVIDALCQQLPSNITVHYGVTLQQFESSCLTDQDGTQFRAPLIIAADGPHSWLRQQLHLAINQHDYHQQAIVATVNTELSHQQTAYQRFLSTGPLAFLPLADEHHCSIVWSADKPHAQHLLSIDDAAFNQQITAALQQRLGKVELTSTRYHFPLQSLHLQTYVQAGVALIGDAAHVIHPLAGQGVNLGFADAACLADTIKQALNNKQCYYARHTLRKYERARKADNTLVQLSMTGLNRLFSNDHRCLSLIRGQGIKLINQLPSVKQWFMQQASD